LNANVVLDGNHGEDNELTVEEAELKEMATREETHRVNELNRYTRYLIKSPDILLTELELEMDIMWDQSPISLYREDYDFHHVDSDYTYENALHLAELCG
jgi:hypothetical protein